MKEFVKNILSGFMLLIPIAVICVLLICTVYNFGNDTVRNGFFIVSLLYLSWFLGHIRRNGYSFTRKKE